MMWLPRLLPPQIRVVVSVTEHIVSVDSPLPDPASPRRTRSYVELKRRACPMLVVQPLRPEARDRILRHYVDRHKVTPWRYGERGRVVACLAATFYVSSLDSPE